MANDSEVVGSADIEKTPNTAGMPVETDSTPATDKIQITLPDKPVRPARGPIFSRGTPTLKAVEPKKPEKHVDIDEHLLSFEDFCKRYTTSFNADKPAESEGLSETAAATKLKEDGLNMLTPPKKKSWVIRYLECLVTLFNLLLIIAGILVYILYAVDPINNAPNVYLGAILIGVAFLNAFIEFYQLQKSASILESFMVSFLRLNTITI